MAKKNRVPVAEMNTEQKAIHEALKAKKAKKKEARKEALLALIQFAKDNGDAEIQKIADSLRPSRSGVTTFTRAPSVRAMFLDLMPEVGDTVSEDEVWSKLKLGRAEMRKKIVQAIKKAEPDDRVWVALDAAKGEYRMAGIGAVLPEGWIGYVPVDVE